MKNKILYTILFCCCAFWSSAQDLGLHTMKNVWQINKTNPAMIGHAKFGFTLPALTTNLGNSAFSYNDLLSTNSNGETVLNGNQFVTLLDEQNSAWARADAETFNIHFGGEQWRVFIHHSFRSEISATYPKTLAQLMFEGNAQFAGQTIDIGPEFNATAFSEIGIGGAIQFTQITIGARLKMLNGIGNISTDQSLASLFTDDQSIYELTVASDYRINAAGMVDIIGLADPDVDTEINVEDPNLSPFGSNKGFAIDFGLTYQLSERWQVAASVLDFGKISWKENTKNFVSQGDYTFKGIDLIEVIEDDSMAFENTLDTLSDIFNFQETAGSYSTALSMNSFFSTNFQVSKMFRIGAMVHLRSSKGNITPTYALSANADFGKIFSMGTVVSHNSYTPVGVGLNGMLQLGPVQVFALTDNVLSAFKVLDSRSAHFRFGINLTFGSHLQEDHNEQKNPTPEDRLSTMY